MSSLTIALADFALYRAAATASGTRADSDPAEAAWVERARRRDADAFRRLVDRHRDGIVDLCARIVHSREEAEEAAQDTFVRAWNALPSFRSESRFSTWLYRIAVRRALDAARSTRVRRGRERPADPTGLEAPAPPAGLPDAQQRRLRRILAALDPVPRAIVALYYAGGGGIAEVAAVLEMPEGTVKTHLHRARETLRRAWIRETAREERDGLPRV